ncbi:carbonic anhydrase [Coralliovum pocilloporae]|uniref:carbonic anhydrase n=1 Tax=Coralliovum pocilloporae TaxID=3066369 RepID=UPI003D9C0ED1
MTDKAPFPHKLLVGYDMFREGRLAQERSRYEALARRGQKPEVMIISCCDSRAAPETIFDCGPGELFVVRNVANLVPPYAPDGDYHGTSAALEFAVQALKVQHIVVMGHGSCGGVKASLDDSFQALSEGDFIGKWISMLKPAIETLACLELEDGDDRQRALEYAGIRQSISHLRSFPYVAEQEKAGQLSLHGAWFDISSGELRTMNPETGSFDNV